MRTRLMQTEWPGGFKAGAAVVCNGENCHVVAVPQGVVPDGHVPVMYDDECGCFIDVPADDLSRRY